MSTRVIETGVFPAQDVETPTAALYQRQVAALQQYTWWATPGRKRLFVVVGRLWQLNTIVEVQLLELGRDTPETLTLAQAWQLVQEGKLIRIP